MPLASAFPLFCACINPLFMELRMSSTANYYWIEASELFYQIADTKDSNHPGHVKTGCQNRSLRLNTILSPQEKSICF